MGADLLKQCQTYISLSISQMFQIVRNRVDKILDITEVIAPKYIHTKENSADDALRGIKQRKTVELNLRLKGPLFLRLSSGKWNTDDNIEDSAFDVTVCKAEIATVSINHIKLEKSHSLEILSESASTLVAENSVTLLIKYFYTLRRKLKDAKISNNELKIINIIEPELFY